MALDQTDDDIDHGRTVLHEEVKRRLLPNLTGRADAAWEQRLADFSPQPKLEAFLRDAAAEGGDEPLDRERLFAAGLPNPLTEL